MQTRTPPAQAISPSQPSPRLPQKRRRPAPPSRRYHPVPRLPCRIAWGVQSHVARYGIHPAPSPPPAPTQSEAPHARDPSASHCARGSGLLGLREHSLARHPIRFAGQRLRCGAMNRSSWRDGKGKTGELRRTPTCTPRLACSWREPWKRWHRAATPLSTQVAVSAPLAARSPVLSRHLNLVTGGLSRAERSWFRRGAPVIRAGSPPLSNTCKLQPRGPLRWRLPPRTRRG